MKCILLVFLLAHAALAGANGGHDHGLGASAPTGVAAPRFGTHSDLFELVGVLERDTLVLYLDRYATNEPVTDARIEVAGEGAGGVAAPAQDGTYRIVATALEQPGRHALVFTVTHGGDADLLEGTLEVAAARTEAHAHGPREWLAQGWPYALAALIAIAAASLVMRRRGGRS